MLVSQGLKVIVTQPRRLPCKLIHNYILSQFGENIVGWEVEGQSQNNQNPLLYMTDGLLKGKIFYDQQYLKNYNVVILDELHERSQNIDILLGLLAYQLQSQSKSENKLKVILSSATIDDQVIQPYVKNNLKVEELITNCAPLYTIEEKVETSKSYMTILLEEESKLQNDEQILIFLSNTKEIYQAVSDFQIISKKQVFPLFANQKFEQQEENLKNGQIFFSTNIAETSLTFPKLKIVIDTGLTNTAYFDFSKNILFIKEEYISKDQTKQRKGRVGRTCDGIYIQNFDEKKIKQQHIVSEFERLNILDFELKLWNIYYDQHNSYLAKKWKGLQDFQSYLPTQPPILNLQSCHEQLQQHGIINNQFNDLTDYGKKICQLPFDAQLENLIALQFGLENQCGWDIILLVSILQQQQNIIQQILQSIIIKKKEITQQEKQAGEYLIIYNTFYQFKNICDQKLQQNNKLKEIKISCFSKEEQNNLPFDSQYLSIFIKTYKYHAKNYQKLQNYKNNKNELIYKQSANLSCKNQIDDLQLWQKLKKCLIKGYYKNCFMKESICCGESKSYIKLSPNPNNQVKAILINKNDSIFNKPNFIITSNYSFNSQYQEQAIINIFGIIDFNELTDFQIIRTMKICKEEKNQIENQQIYQDNILLVQSIQDEELILKGICNQVIQFEKQLNQLLIDNNLVKNVNLQEILDQYYLNKFSQNQKNQILKNLDLMLKLENKIFLNYKYYYKFQYQVQSKLDKKNTQFNLQGRTKYTQNFYNGIKDSLKFLNETQVVSNNISIQTYEISQSIQQKQQIEERIKKITLTRQSYDIWESTIGSKATRITRMEVVCWIACTQFNCIVEGGFIRDWIIGGQQSIQNKQPFKKVKDINQDTIPFDLDIYLPHAEIFKIQYFKKKLLESNIVVNQILFQNWRYILYLDEDTPTGPFSIDLIEPHVSIMFDKIDFDVNNLCCIKSELKLGMKIDLSLPPIYLSIEQIINNIQNKKFNVMKNLDQNGILQFRIDKMKLRGWTQIQQNQIFDIRYQPSLDNISSYQQIFPKDQLYKDMQNDFNQNNFKIVRIEQISNKTLHQYYEKTQQLIQKDMKGKSINEKMLYFGIQSNIADQLINNGFTNQYFIDGNFGNGLYFSNKLQKSHTLSNSVNNEKVMLYCQVILGNQEKKDSQDDNTKKIKFPSLGYHSIYYNDPSQQNFNDYILYNENQAKVILKLTYN